MGVKVVHTVEQIRDHMANLYKDCPVILAEEFLNGEEITIAVMPPGEYDVSTRQLGFSAILTHPRVVCQQPVGTQSSHWTLPIVIRSQHINDVTPYSGVQVVALNSAAITPERYLEDKEEYEKVERRVKRAGEIMGTKAVVRIDCRRDSQGEFKLFDVNMKPVSGSSQMVLQIMINRL
jgi:D-alanine-D-alanine ligase